MLLQNGKGDKNVQNDFVTLSDENHTNRYDLTSLHLSLEKGGTLLTVRLFSESGATQLSLSGEDLRTRDPKTGTKLHDEGNVTNVKKGACNSSDKIILDQYQHIESKFIPIKIDKKGHYGYEIEFQDGATIIYSLLSVAIAAGAEVQK